jgi:hypothetical protein
LTGAVLGGTSINEPSAAMAPYTAAAAPGSSPSACNLTDNTTHPSWQPQPPGSAAGDASVLSSPPNSMAPRNPSVPSNTTTPTDIGAAASCTQSLDIGATNSVTTWNKLSNIISRSPRISKSIRRRILLLCAGPDDRFDGLIQLLKNAGYEPDNYDTANGAQFDLVDDAISDPIAARVAGGEYVAAFASPDCSTYSKLHNLPGPPPLRDAEGVGRYGKPDLKPRQQERVRRENIVADKVAQILELFTARWLPWLLEAPEASTKQVSILNLNEFMALAGRPGVKRVTGVQCPFAGLS